MSDKMIDEGRGERSIGSEIILSIGNIAHAEQHLSELLASNIENATVSEIDTIKDEVKRIRESRQIIMRILIKNAPAAKGLWCVVKHMAMSEIQCYELFASTGDSSALKVAKSLRESLDNLLELDDVSEWKTCSRCEEKNMI